MTRQTFFCSVVLFLAYLLTLAGIVLSIVGLCISTIPENIVVSILMLLLSGVLHICSVCVIWSLDKE